MTSNKFRMVYKVDGNSQLDSRHWSMYSNTFKAASKSFFSKTNYRASFNISEFLLKFLITFGEKDPEATLTAAENKISNFWSIFWEWEWE